MRGSVDNEDHPVGRGENRRHRRRRGCLRRRLLRRPRRGVRFFFFFLFSFSSFVYTIPFTSPTFHRFAFTRPSHVLSPPNVTRLTKTTRIIMHQSSRGLNHELKRMIVPMNVCRPRIDDRLSAHVFAQLKAQPRETRAVHWWITA